MRKWWLAGLAAAVVVVVLVVARRHDVVRFALERVADVATGYSVNIADQRLGISHGALLDVRVSHKGEPVLDAARIDIYYSLRDMLPGSTHRFGLTGIAIDAANLTIVRHADGSYNIILPSGGTSSSPGRADPIPLRFFARLRNGTATLIDQSDYTSSHAVQGAIGIHADLTLNSSSRTHYTIGGAFEAQKKEPFSAVGTIDLTRGYAMHRLRAQAIPIRTFANVLINSKAARVLSGEARAVDATLYAFDVAPNQPIDYHVGARLEIVDGSMDIGVLAVPLENIRGHLVLVDDAVIGRNLTATIARIPVAAEGGIFDFAQPQFRFGISGRGDVASLRSAFAFSKNEPVSGYGSIGALIEGPVSEPIVVASARLPHATYRALPIDNVRASVAVALGHVFIAPASGNYAGLMTKANGVLTLGTPLHRALQTELLAHVETRADNLPYLDEVAPGEPLAADVIFHGDGDAFGAGGELVSLRGEDRVAALFTFHPNGVAEVAPFNVSTGNGDVSGRYELDRRTGSSAFWLLANDISLHPPTKATFPGLHIAQMPALGGTLAYGAAVGGGNNSSDLVIAGRVSANDAMISNVAFDSLDAVFAGNLDDAAISAVHADGPWGRFDGKGSFSTTRIVVAGGYAGDLAGLRPFIGELPAAGPVSGPITLSIASEDVVVQARGLRFGAGAQVHGVAFQRLSGTIAYQKGDLHVYNATAQVANGRLVAAGTYARGGIALVANNMGGAGLHGLGIPIDGGDVAISGTVRDDAGTIPAFDGGVVVRNGTASGYPVKGTAILALHDAALRVTSGVAALGSTYAYINGTVGDLSSREPSYALRADVPAGDIASTLQALRLPTYETQGVFNGRLAIGGAGQAPSVSGPVGVPGGEVNGLPFVNASADLTASPGFVSARRGRAAVGSTDARFFATIAPAAEAFGLNAQHADLADFDNFFDTGDTLDGTGSLALGATFGDRRVATRGDINVRGFRYRSLPLGNTVAHWSSRSNAVTGTIAVKGTHGSLHAGGSIDFAPSHQLQRVIADSRYDVTATLDNVDLSTWLPAAGYPEIPLLGQVDASARIRGAYPRLSLTGLATLSGGSFARLPIDTLTAGVYADSGGLHVQNAELEAPGISATADGTFGLGATAPIALNVHASTNDLPMLVQEVAKKTIDVKGAFESTLHIGGTFAKPTYDAAFDATDVSAYGVQVASIFGSVRLVGDGLELRNAGATFAHGTATLAGTLPLQLQPFGIAQNRPLSFDLEVDGLDPSAVQALLGSNTKLGGSIDAHIGLSGTRHSPQIFGHAQVSNGSYVSDLDTVPVTATVATVTFNRRTATLQSFRGSFGSGTVSGKGDLSFAQGFGVGGDVSYALHAVASGAQVNLPAYGSGAIDGTADLIRTPPGLAKLTGAATLNDGSVPFAAFLGGTKTVPVIGSGTPLNVAFGLKLTAGKNVRIRGGGYGAGLDIGASGEAMLGGTLAAPTLDGKFVSTGGTLTYFDRAFTMQSGSVTFTPADGIVPELRAVAVTHVLNPDTDINRNPYGTTDVTIAVAGRLPNLTVNLESTPSGYTKEQLIALIAPFGGLVSSIALNGGTQPITGTAPGLAGAPVTPTGALPAGVLVERSNGTITVGQEAFSILNAQFTSGLLAPLETALGEAGIGSVDLSVDYYGGVGVNVRHGIGRFINAVYATTFGLVQRQSFGIQYAPSDATAAELTFFFENGPQQLEFAPTLTSSNYRVTAGQAITGQSGFSFTLQRLFW